MGWIEIVQVPCFVLDEVAAGNEDCIDKSPTRVRPLLNQTRLYIYLHSREVVFDNGYIFKRYSIPLLQDFSIRLVCTAIKPISNTLVDQAHQVIYNMLVLKDLDTKVFDHIHP